MESAQSEVFSACASSSRTLLFVTNHFYESDMVLDFACELAEKSGAHLELLHVTDPDRTPSTPDGQMGTQFNLEMLAGRFREFKGSALGLLLYGSLEDLVPKRSAEIRATVVVFPLLGSQSDHCQRKLVRRLKLECNCPVLALPLNFRDEDMARLVSVLRPIFSIGIENEPNHISSSTLERSLARAWPQAPIITMTRRAVLLGS